MSLKLNCAGVLNIPSIRSASLPRLTTSKTKYNPVLPKVRGWVAIAFLFLLSLSGNSMATVLDFNYLDNNLPEGFYYGVNPINTNGFTISNSSNAYALGVYGSNSSHQADPGQAAVAVNSPNSITSLVKADNSIFTFNTIDLADYYNSGGTGTIQFTFFDGSNNTTSQVTTLDALIGLQTFGVNISGLSKVSWQTITGSYGMSQFDNIVVDVPVVSPISLPGTLPLMLAGLGALGFSARHRKDAIV